MSARVLWLCLCYSWQNSSIKIGPKRFQFYLHLSICFSSLKYSKPSACLCRNFNYVIFFQELSLTAQGGNTSLDYSLACSVLTIETTFAIWININVMPQSTAYNSKMRPNCRETHKNITAELLLWLAFTCFVYETWGISGFALLWTNYKKWNKTFLN